jgi:hypothetical protein
LVMESVCSAVMAETLVLMLLMGMSLCAFGLLRAFCFPQAKVLSRDHLAGLCGSAAAD